MTSFPAWFMMDDINIDVFNDIKAMLTGSHHAFDQE